MTYIIEHVYNNNVILVQKDGKEVILVGKGVGFNKKRGEKIAFDASSHKLYYEIAPEEAKFNEKIVTDEKVKEITDQIIYYAQTKLGILNSNISKVLFEHIQFALERLNIGLKIDNPFVEQIKILYPKEFEIANYGARLISKNLEIQIGEEEMGFIALHIYSAKKNNSLTETMQLTRICTESISIIEQTYNITINMSHPSVTRFFSNFKYIISMCSMDKGYATDSVKKRSSYYKIAQKIIDLFEKQQKKQVNSVAIPYLAVEIEKLVQFNQ